MLARVFFHLGTLGQIQPKRWASKQDNLQVREERSPVRRVGTNPAEYAPDRFFGHTSDTPLESRNACVYGSKCAGEDSGRRAHSPVLTLRLMKGPGVGSADRIGSKWPCGRFDRCCDECQIDSLLGH